MLVCVVVAFEGGRDDGCVGKHLVVRMCFSWMTREESDAGMSNDRRTERFGFSDSPSSPVAVSVSAAAAAAAAAPLPAALGSTLASAIESVLASQMRTFWRCMHVNQTCVKNMQSLGNGGAIDSESGREQVQLLCYPQAFMRVKKEHPPCSQQTQTQ